MKNLFKFELRKLFRMRLLYICLGLVAVLAFLIGLGYYFIQKMAESSGFGEMLGTFNNYTAISLLRSELAEQNGTIVIALFVTLFLCDDNRNRTLKNIYGRGYGRDGVYFSKLIVALSVSIVFVLIDWLFAFAFGCAFFGVGSNDGTLGTALVLQLLAVISYVTLFFFLTTVIKKTGGSVVCNVLVVMFFSLILTLIDLLIYQLTKSDSFMISDYWISGIIQNAANGTKSNSYIAPAVILPLIYSAAFIVGGMFVNRKREV